MGSGTHFDGERLKNQTGIDLVHVPYRSTTLAVQDVAADNLDMAMDGGAKPYVDSGKVRILAVTGEERDPRFPNVPPAVEAGLAGFVVEAFMAAFAPAGTPPEIVKVLNQSLNAALADPGVRSRLAELGMTPHGGPPAELARLVRRRIDEYRSIIQGSKLKFG